MSKREDVIAAIRALEDDEGRLTPDAVVKAARNRASPLHGYFEWNDAVAAEVHRTATARRLIASFTMAVRYETVNINVQMYVHDPDAPSGMQGYRNVLHLRKDTDAAREALVAEMGRVSSILKRVRNLATVLGQTEDLDDLELQVSKFLDALASTEPHATP